MKVKDISKLDDNALDLKIKDLKEEFFNLKMQYTTQQLENFKHMYSVKRDIARLKTVRTQRQNKTGSESNDKAERK